MVVWLIGLSGSGKSTVGRKLTGRLRGGGHGVVFLDGDLLRDVWGDRIGHTLEERRVNAHRISHLCRLLDEQGIDVVAAVLSVFPEWQRWNREQLSHYFEVFLDVPLELLKARDPKGLYRRALAGEERHVVGLDIPFPTPWAPDLVLKPEDGDADAMVERILGALSVGRR